MTPLAQRVSLGSGSPEGENSAYVLPEHRAVVDPGPPVESAWDRLVAGIEDAGLALGDLDYVFVTHWHVDHAGLAPRLAEMAGATVVMHETDAPLVSDYAREREQRVERDARRLRAWGIPESVVDNLRAGDQPSPMPDSFPVEAVSDGDVVGSIEAIHTPGHTLGHAAFLAEGERADADLFVGDLVLPTYTPNVGGGDTRLGEEGQLGGALATYLTSLNRLLDVGVAVGCPGHGSPLALAERVDEIRTHHDERSRRTVAALDEVSGRRQGVDVGRGPTGDDAATAWDVAQALFGELAGIHAKMGVGEAASHLDYLENRGAVERVTVDGDGGGDRSDKSDDEPRRYRVVDTERAGLDE